MNSRVNSPACARPTCDRRQRALASASREMREAAGSLLALHGARAPRAGPRLLRGRRASSARRRLRHRAGAGAAVRPHAGAPDRRCSTATRSSNSAPAAARSRDAPVADARAFELPDPRNQPRSARAAAARLRRSRALARAAARALPRRRCSRNEVARCDAGACGGLAPARHHGARRRPFPATADPGGRPGAGEAARSGENDHAEPPYESEIGLVARAWIASSPRAWTRRHPLHRLRLSAPRVLPPAALDGTLMCHYRHRAHDDPFFLPGLQDITAHVDFTALAEAAARPALDVLGYTTQAQFLVNCGITEFSRDAERRGRAALRAARRRRRRSCSRPPRWASSSR